MTEIVPDTSKYTDLPNKLRAFAVLSEAGDEIECRDIGGVWKNENSGYSVEDRLVLLVKFRDYRSKPKPRELWALFDDAGIRRDVASEERYLLNIADRRDSWTVVRFVEQPE